MKEIQQFIKLNMARNYINIGNLTREQQEDIQAHIRGLSPGSETYTAPNEGWVCFHCGEVFKTYQGAKLHFGEAPIKHPSCIEDKND